MWSHDATKGATTRTGPRMHALAQRAGFALVITNDAKADLSKQSGNPDLKLSKWLLQRLSS